MPTPQLTLGTLPDGEPFRLPPDAVTQTFGILAKRGAGKSNAAVVVAEQMHDAGIPWVAIDPKGDWWGVRSGRDGGPNGLPIPVFGGLHGDIPLEPTAARLVADLVVDQRLSCVLDVSEFSRADQRRFLLPFAERLLRRNTEPLHLFLEEAHEYLPQRVMRDQAELVGAWAKVVKQGRFRGLGCTLISQRSASLNKDVLTQIETLIVMRNPAPQDRKAIEAWVAEHDFTRELMESLPSLPTGTAWIWSPEWLGGTFRVAFAQRRTFDSGATPTIGKAARPPANLADVDLAALKEAMEETIERAKATDPAELQRRIRQLTKELDAERKRRPEPEIREVGVPYVPAELSEGLRDAARVLDQLATAAEGLPVIEVPEGTAAIAVPQRPRPKITNDPPLEHAWADEGARGARDASRASKGARALPPAPTRIEPSEQAGQDARATRDNEDLKLGGGERRLLAAVAHFPAGQTRAQAATRAKLKRTGGTFTKYLSTLKGNGLINVAGNQLTITDAGLAALGYYGTRPALTGQALRDDWLAKLGGPNSGARRMLQYLIDNCGHGYTRVELAAAVDLEVDGGTFTKYLSTLRTNELIYQEGAYVYAAAILCED